MALDAVSLMRARVRGTPSWPGHDPETGYVGADRSDHSQKLLADGAGHTGNMAKGYSIHIGLNLVNPAHYGGWDGRLRACEADANDMAAIARSLGYTHSTTLLTKDATSPRVISEVLRLSRTLRSGDILL